MTGKSKRKRGTLLLTVILLGGLLAASANADAAAPWFGPGAPKPGPREDQHRNLYREQRFIRQMYQGFLNRQPSSNELRFWTEQLGKNLNPTELVKEFMGSDEFFIRETYRGVLGREPDPSGMSAHMRALQGGQSRYDVIEALLASKEFRNRLR